MIARFLQSYLSKTWNNFPIVVLTGPRQVGKSTLARSFLPEARYLTLDDYAVMERARQAPEDLLPVGSGPTVIDEVQYVPDLLRYLKLRVDADRTAGQWLLTGAESHELRQSVGQYLVGRAAVLELDALGLEELPATGASAVEQLWWRGGYPELWRQPDLDRGLWYASYVATYLERDVRNLLRVGDLRDFDRFLRAAALRVGQLLSLSELARDVGIAPNTAKQWLSVLATSGLVFLLEPYFANLGKRLTKSPKLYFADTGLLCWLLGFREPAAVVGHAQWGAIWENLVVAEVRKSYRQRGIPPSLWFWRNPAGDEIDLLVEPSHGSFIAIEAKAATQVAPESLRHLDKFAAEYGPEALRAGYVACRTANAYPLAAVSAQRHAVPLWGTEGLLARLHAATAQ